MEEDQQSVIDAYMDASEKMVASTIEVRVKNVKSGSIVRTRMTTAPVGHAGHVFTAHFLSNV
jgi:hypothetical protein